MPPLGPGGSLATDVVTSFAQDTITPETVDIPQVTSPGLYDIDPHTADDENLQLASRSHFINAMIQHDPTAADQFRDLGIINPTTNQVDLSDIDAAQVTHLNNQLEQRLPDEVSQEVSELTKKRSEIAGDYGLTIPDKFTGRS